METAVSRVLRALDRHERIVLFGDYDVDGVTSLALLDEILRAYGGAPELFLPLRMEEGYGLSRESIERCLEKHRPQLLIAVDCGTSSVAEVADLNKRGVDVIILDHHEPKSEVPDCVAIVNPKTAPCGMEYLCSVGIVFKVCHALLKTRPLPGFDLKSKLDLVALGTVADIVPLAGENRVLVQRGSLEIARTSRIGRKYHRPAIVIGFDENGIGKGSGRSIEGLNMVAALTHCANSLDKYGGHEMAAGLAVREENFHCFAEAFRTIARELLSKEALQPSLRLDDELAFTDINVEFLRWHEMLQPFGNGNPQPLFFAREIEPVAPPRIVNDKHLIFRLRQGDRHRRAVYFNGVADQLPPPPWDIAFRIRAAEYGGETLVSMQIEAVRAAERCDCDQ